MTGLPMNGDLQMGKAKTMTKNGVSFYRKGTILIEVNFPDGDVCCAYCFFCRSKTVNSHTRVVCTRSYEELHDVNSRVGEDCILKFESERNEGLLEFQP